MLAKITEPFGLIDQNASSVYKSSVVSVIEIHHVGRQSEPTVINLLSNTSACHIQGAVCILLTSCCSDWMLI